MSRDIHADTAAAVQADSLAPIGMVALEFASGAMRMWTGIGDLAYGGFTWTGAGRLGRIGAVEETSEVRAVGVTLELSGIPAEILEIANNEDWQGRPAAVYFAVLDGRSFVGEPIQIFAGIMDQMTMADGKNPSITLACESNLIDLERTRARRWTAESQRSEFPGDAGLDMVAALQQVDILWGRS